MNDHQTRIYFIDVFIMVYFYLPQLFVLQGHLLGSKRRVGFKHPFAVKAGFILDLALIDARAVFLDLYVLSKALVAHQAFGAFLDLFGKGLDNCLPVGGIFPLLRRIYANDVTTTVYLDLFYFKRSRLFRVTVLGPNPFVPARVREHAISDLFDLQDTAPPGKLSDTLSIIGGAISPDFEDQSHLCSGIFYLGIVQMLK